MRCSTATGTLERDILPPYLAKRRWFAMKDQTLKAVRLASLLPLPGADRELLLAEVETETAGRHGALAAAAGDRLGGPADGGRCRRSLRWRGCGAARGSAC